MSRAFSAWTGEDGAGPRAQHVVAAFRDEAAGVADAEAVAMRERPDDVEEDDNGPGGPASPSARWRRDGSSLGDEGRVVSRRRAKGQVPGVAMPPHGVAARRRPPLLVRYYRRRSRRLASVGRRRHQGGVGAGVSKPVA